MKLLDRQTKKNLSYKNKIYIDCTHTLFFGETAGVQRVVRNIITTSPRVAPPNVDIVPIVWTGSKFITKRNIRFKPIQLLKLLKRVKKLINPILDSLPNLIRNYLRNLVKIFVALITSLFYLFKKPIAPIQGEIIFFPDASWNISSSIFWRVLKRYRQKGVKIGFLFHDIIPIRYPQYCLLEFRSQFSKWFQSALQNTDLFIAVSDTVKKDIITYVKEHNLEIPSNDFNHSGVSFDLSSSRQITHKNNHASSDLEKIHKSSYIFVSTIEPRKNHDYSISAFEILWKEKKFPGQLVIIGRVGWLCDKIMKRIISHPEYGKRLFMKNDASDDDLLHAYQNAAGLIFTSFIEGFGLPIIEGLYYNLPVFASDIPVHREVGGDLVCYCDLQNPHDLAEKIYQSSTQTHSSKRVGRKIDLSKFTWEESCKNLIEKILILSK